MSDLFTNLLLALVMGATVGLERESDNPTDPHVGGIRTFALIALMGALAGIFLLHDYTTMAVVIGIGFFVLLVSYYVAESVVTHDFGITSELSAIATFLLGMLVMLSIIPLFITVAVFVVVVFILSLKSRTTKLVAGISRRELHSFITYAIIALVVLPVLPDYTYQLKDIPLLMDILKGFQADVGQFDTLELINPRRIWFIVVLITGIDVLGYLMTRFIGNKNGFALTSFIAGFVSSTSTTQSLAQKSKTSTYVNHLVGAAVLANLASFIQVILLLAPLNLTWLISILPSILFMIIAAGILAFFFLKKKEPEKTLEPTTDPSEQIFSLMPALKFATLLVVIKIVTKIFLMLFGASGFIISSIVASFVGIDAIMVTLADMAGQSITFRFALITFLIINATNLLSKSFYAWLQGKRSFTYKFLISAIVIALSGALWLVFAGF
jgi:uncharacterized membrane protein (DUF4010 family)